MNDAREALIGTADIIKVDLKGTTADEQRVLVKRYGRGCRMLAEKVETREQFHAYPGPWLRVLPGIFLPASRSNANSRYPQKQVELPADASGSLVQRTGPPAD